MPKNKLYPFCKTMLNIQKIRIRPYNEELAPNYGKYMKIPKLVIHDFGMPLIYYIKQRINYGSNGCQQGC